MFLLIYISCSSFYSSCSNFYFCCSYSSPSLAFPSIPAVPTPPHLLLPFLFMLFLLPHISCSSFHFCCSYYSPTYPAPLSIFAVPTSPHLLMLLLHISCSSCFFQCSFYPPTIFFSLFVSCSPYYFHHTYHCPCQYPLP